MSSRPTFASNPGMKQVNLLALACLLLGGLALPHCTAQEVYAQIKGIVKDQTGGTVAGATISAANTRTGESTSVRSDADGSFHFLQLPVGNYDVTVTKQGFSTFTENDVHLLLNQVFNLPVELQLGRVDESVDVNADRAQVETATTQLGNIIEAPTIVDLPLNGRDWTQLQQLTPGVVAASDRSGTYATNGSQSQQNSYLINGADSIDVDRNLPSIIPSPDAIQEFNFITSTINPEYDRNSGGVLNAVIKAGTNQFHGSAFEFYRDTFLNGRNLFQQSAPVFHQNQFGGTLGGPLWKDRTFFFVSYQGTRFRQPESGSNQTTVFTAAQRNGYFPDVATSTAPSPVPLIGESGATYPAGTPYDIVFPTGHIPSADFNPISQKLLNYVPLPNAPGGLYQFNPLQIGQQNQGIARLDHDFSWRDKFWTSMFFEDSPTTSTLPNFGATLPGFGQLDARAYKQFTADWTHIFSPTSLNEFRASYLRFNYAAVFPQNAVLPSSVGFTGVNPQDATGAGIPLISVNGYFNLGFSPAGPQPRIDENYQLTDSFSKVVGNHTLKFGFDGKRYNVNNPFLSYNNGAFSFGGNGPYSTGDPGADFLLGIPDTFQQQSGGWISARTYEYYAYAQDSWKVTNNLTLNYGLGYQIDTPIVNSRFGGEDINCFRPGSQSVVFPTAPAGLLFPGDQGCSSSGYYDHYDHFAPRFGFAWSPGSGTDSKSFVVRGGFGVYFNRSEEELTLQDLSAVPFSLTSYGISGAAGALGITNPSPSFANPYQDIATGQSIPNPFPFTPATRGSNVNFAPYEPFDINTINPNFTAPYAMNFNLNVQRELPGAMIFQIGYVGSLGRHLEMTYEGNPISPAGQAACAADPSCIANRAAQHVLYPTHALNAPGDIFASVGTQATDGVSNYNSLQVSLTKRLTHGLSFLAAYTWSHSIDDTSGYELSSNGYRGINPYDFASYRGDSTYDARQRFVLSYDYELPHLPRSAHNSILHAVADGWHVSGITTLQTGFPILVADTGLRSLSCDAYTYYGCPDAPNAVGTVNILNPRTSSVVNTTRNPQNTNALPYYWFNPNSFALEPIGTLGDEGRNNFHGPGINNTDLGLFKRFYFRGEERRWLELRAEAYNVFNHTQFTSIPLTSLGSGTNGDINSGNFGQVLSAAPGRTVQLGAKIYF